MTTFVFLKHPTIISVTDLTNYKILNNYLPILNSLIINKSRVNKDVDVRRPLFRRAPPHGDLF